jgi:RNA polymerase sigma-70 factor, ECF subfamily
VGGRGDFEWLLEQEIPHLRRFAHALTGDPTEADDLVQDCLERALRKWFLWRRRGRLRSWLFRVLYRVFLNDRRGRGPERSGSALLEPGPAAAPPTIECVDTVHALERLGEEQRTAILLVALEDLSYEEAARVMRIPVGTLRSRIHRGRERLRELTGTEQTAPAPVLRAVK